MNHWEILALPHGEIRRALILKYLEGSDHGICINSRWGVPIKKDPDLMYLLKKGKIKTMRSPSMGFSFKRQSYIVLKDG